ncbi:mobilisation protein [Fibrisoma limi BUZ 3]|uniref:Mobilisation protein n=1 Tax=Fibrisoma limi BUZ 3 TaxID=1185876 RepID=I2GRK6_9BACT|nr:plasmid mobilization relaxosome protein MobC [Fibrisoma limi]CCH56534.1 mobilisation protein [Fibrisoma limi BUZ 3]
MARPLKSDDKRDLTIRVRVTATEKRRIWEQAQRAGQTPSDYVRLQAMATTQPLRRVPTPERKILLDVLAELGKVGSNINQIARSFNASRESGQLASVSPEDINAAMQGLDALTAHCLKLLNDGH